MTTPPVDPEPPADMKDPESENSAPTGDESDHGEDSGDTDAMGINDDDPIDATLVGAPVDQDEAADIPDERSADDRSAADSDD